MEGDGDIDGSGDGSDDSNDGRGSGDDGGGNNSGYGGSVGGSSGNNNDNSDRPWETARPRIIGGTLKVCATSKIGGEALKFRKWAGPQKIVENP